MGVSLKNTAAVKGLLSAIVFCLLVSIVLVMPYQGFAAPDASLDISATSSEEENADEQGNDNRADYIKNDGDEGSDSLDSQVDVQLTGEAHVQDEGWLPEQSALEGESIEVGTTGKGERLEAIRLSVEVPEGVEGSIAYQVHVQDYGWMGWVDGDAEDNTAGTTGEAKRIEAIKIRLTGALADLYDVWYCAHVQNIGWMGWAGDGGEAGSSGYGLQMEALRIKLCGKGGFAPDAEDSPYLADDVRYSAHVENYGWLPAAADGEVGGTTGRGLRLEAVAISLPDAQRLGDLGIAYRAHVQDRGWSGWVSNGAVAGSVGQGLRLEAIQIALTGADAAKYDLYYQTHAANIGWLGLVRAGTTADDEAFYSGTSNACVQLEAIRIYLVPIAGGTAPADDGAPAFLSPSMVVLDCGSYSDVLNAWGAAGAMGTAGTVGRGLSLLGMTLEAVSDFAGDVLYNVHLANIGWLEADKMNGEVAGTLDPGNAIQAIRISLTDELSKYFDVYYRAHIADYGWLGWAANGGNAGTSGLGIDAQAYQVFITVKGGAAPGSTARSFSDENGFFNALYLGVPVTWNQYSVGLPTGCESMALTHLLQYWGFDLAPSTIADNYMPWSSYDFVYSFRGNPHTYSGWAIMAPGLTNTANSFLSAMGSALCAYNITGTAFRALYDYLIGGKPVVVWTTGNQQDPQYVASQDGYDMYSGTHTVVLDGFDKRAGTIHVADSINGPQWLDAGRFAQIYDWMGAQAVVIQ